jgi:cytochrome P450
VFLPPGTAVGINPYITGRNAAVFGPDAEEFCPERWLRLPKEDDASYAARLRMQRTVADLNFGAGSRICLGKNLGIMETFKIVATVLNRYDIILEGRDGGWEVQGGWVRKPARLMVKLRARG